MPESTTPPLRGRRGRDRRIAEQVAKDFAARHPRPKDEDVVDFDIGAVDAEVDDARRAEARPAAAPEEAEACRRRLRRRRAPDRRRPPAARPLGPARRCSPRPARSARSASASVRRRTSVGSAATPGSSPSRTARSRTSPRPSRPRSRWSGSPATPRSAIASPRSWAPGWATPRPSPSSSHAPPWPTSAASSSRTRPPPASRRSPPGAAAGPGSSSPASRRCSSTPSRPTTCRPSRGSCASAPGSTRTRCCATCSISATRPSPRSPVAASSRGAAASSTCSRRRWTCRSGSSSSATRSTRCAPSTRPTSGRPGKVERAVLLPASEFLLPTAGVAAIRERLGKAASRLGSASGPTSPVSRARPTTRFGPSPPARHGRWPSATRPRSGPPSSLRRPASTTSIRARCSCSTSPATSPRPPRSCGARPTSGAPSSWRPASCPRTGPRPTCRRATGRAGSSASRTLELTWESEPPTDVAMASGGRELGRPVRVARAGAAARAGEPAGRRGRGWREDGDRIVLASDQAPRLAEILEEAGHPVAVVERIEEPPPPGAIALVGRSLNGGFVGGPDGLAFVTDRELFGTVRVRRPKALRRVVPRDILERLTPGDLVVHIDHGVARYEQMLRRGGAGEERDYLELSFAGGDRIFVPVEQIGRVTRYAGGERPQLSKLGGTEWLRAKQRVRKAVADLAEELLGAVRRARRRAGPCLRRRHALAAGDGGVVPVRGDHRPAARVGRGQGGHGAAAADGPARRRRRRLRQDRGRAARRVQGDPGRQAGRGARADDRPRRAAPRDVQPALRRVPARGPHPVAVRVGEGAGGDDRRAWPTGRSTSSSARTAC